MWKMRVLGRKNTREIFSYAYFEVEYADFQLNHACSRHEELVNRVVFNRLSFKGKLQQEILALESP